MNRAQSNDLYRSIAHDGNIEDIRHLAKHDLFFLLTRICGRKDIDRDWLYERCREFEAEPDGYLDLWARDHYKSTIITFGGTIQEVLRNPEATIGIFSHTRPIAKGFLRQIKRECEGNEVLKELFPHIAPPTGKDVRSWSEDGGLCAIRSTNPKEQTVEAHGLVDGQPTSKHFNLLTYDDVVTRESVTTGEMIKKVTEAWALSLNLGMDGGRRRMVGTRYHHNDTYQAIIERGAVKPRVHPATKDGTEEGAPVLLSPETLAQKRRDMGKYVFGCQMLQKPSPDEGMIIQSQWLQFYTRTPDSFQRILLSWDMTFKDNDDSDFVVGQAWGQIGADAYLLDQVRGKWSFTETVKQVIQFKKKWQQAGEVLIEDKANGPAVINTLKHEIPGLIPIEPYGSKIARCHATAPYFESGNVFVPDKTLFGWVEDYLAELTQFPVVGNDDQVDATTQALQRMFSKRPIIINPSVIKREAAISTAIAQGQRLIV